LSRKAFRLAISAVICLVSLCRILRVPVMAAGSTQGQVRKEPRSC
jgi:hypothetical protein